MASLMPAPLSAPESVSGIGRRLIELLTEAEMSSADDQLPQNLQSRIVDSLDALRSRLATEAERDPRSLFDLDERLLDLMDRLEESTADGSEPSRELLQEITDYLESIRTKVDRIAGYWRWQESIAEICGKEAERLEARKNAANGRIERLKSMLLAFLLPRNLKRIEGQKATIGFQVNSTASLVIDDRSQIPAEFVEDTFTFNLTEARELVSQLPDGPIRRRVEAAIAGDGWEINNSALRAAITNSASVAGARLVKGHHVRLR